MFFLPIKSFSLFWSPPPPSRVQYAPGAGAAQRQIMRECTWRGPARSTPERWPQPLVLLANKSSNDKDGKEMGIVEGFDLKALGPTRCVIVVIGVIHPRLREQAVGRCLRQSKIKQRAIDLINIG